MKTIITIGRQFGSGGKEVGIRVAKELGIPFYDKELLQEAAKKSGLCEKIFENFDERPKSLLYSIAMDSYMFALPGAGAGDSLEQQVYLATFNTIRHLAEQGPCVIIGRCADYALADNPNLLSIFIHAPMDVRIARVAKRQNLTPEKARQLILKTDKRRASYYEYYSSPKWGAVESYDFCLDSNYLGLGGTVEQCALLAKRALLLDPTGHSDDAYYADMERCALEKVNRLGIGPQGLGGTVTALSVRILAAPTHIAGLPCVVNMGCHVTRHAEAIL